MPETARRLTPLRCACLALVFGVFVAGNAYLAAFLFLGEFPHFYDKVRSNEGLLVGVRQALEQHLEQTGAWPNQLADLDPALHPWIRPTANGQVLDAWGSWKQRSRRLWSAR